MKKEKVVAFLQSVHLFQDLNRQELERVEEITIPRFVTKKMSIFTEGSEKEAVFFLQEGLVKAYKTDENGHEQISACCLHSEDVLGHSYPGSFHQSRLGDFDHLRKG